MTETFDTRKIPGLEYIDMRQNLIRLLSISYKNRDFISHGTYYYSSNLTTHQLIYQKIYNMSGLIFNKKLDWGTHICNFTCDITENDKLKIKDAHLDKNEIIATIYINHVVDLWIFLLQPIAGRQEYHKMFLDIINSTINNCRVHENRIKDKSKAIINMFVIIQNMTEFSNDKLDFLIDHYIKQDNWSKFREISLSLAHQMHCDLLNQFTLITKKARQGPITIPPESQFVFNLFTNCKATKMVAYLPGRVSQYKDIYDNQYQNYYINSNGIITFKKQSDFTVDDETPIFEELLEEATDEETTDEEEGWYICAAS